MLLNTDSEQVKTKVYEKLLKTKTLFFLYQTSKDNYTLARFMGLYTNNLFILAFSTILYIWRYTSMLIYVFCLTTILKQSKHSLYNLQILILLRSKRNIVHLKGDNTVS